MPIKMVHYEVGVGLWDLRHVAREFRLTKAEREELDATRRSRDECDNLEAWFAKRFGEGNAKVMCTFHDIGAGYNEYVIAVYKKPKKCKNDLTNEASL